MPGPNKLTQNYGGQRIITGFFTLDFANTAAGARSALLQCTGLTGARKGDVAIVAPLARAGVQQFGGDVVADDRVDAFFDNITAGAVDPAAQDFVVTVIKTS